MKKIAATISALLVSTAMASAADMAAAPAYKAAPMAAPVAFYNWSGFYIGGHVGGGWGTEGSTELAPGTVAFPTGTVFTSHDTSGFLGGVQGGFNWQGQSPLVIGVEGEYSWADLSGTASTTSTVNGFVTTSTARTRDIAMATGRVGYAANNWLFFAKGGWAWVQGTSSGTGVTGRGVFFDTTSSSTDRNGWIVGVGIEWGFAPNWSAKLEYNHADFGSTTVGVVSSLGTTNFVSSSERIDIVKAGINYRFGWGGPVMAKY